MQNLKMLNLFRIGILNFFSALEPHSPIVIDSQATKVVREGSVMKPHGTLSQMLLN
jgi:hypothetical protein